MIHMNFQFTNVVFVKSFFTDGTFQSVKYAKKKNNNNIIIIFREVDLFDFKRFFLEIPGFHTGFLSGQSSTIICKDNVTMDLFDHIFWF